MMMRERNHPFSAAFEAWYAAATDLHDFMAIELSADRDTIEISFLIGDGALHGHAHAGGISIVAAWKGEIYDMLWDDDLIAQHGPQGWFCSLCSPTDRPYFPTVEALWIEHLFDSFRRWVDGQLRPAVMLEFHRRDGATWAKLRRQRDGQNGGDCPTCWITLGKDIRSST